MMKKALAYAMTAILLGTVTMLAPVMLLKSSYYGQLAFGDGEDVPMGLPKLPRYCPEDEERLGFGVVNETLDRAEAFGRTLCPSNLSSAGLMLIPSFFLALGVSIYLKKRTF